MCLALSVVTGSVLAQEDPFGGSDPGGGEDPFGGDPGVAAAPAAAAGAKKPEPDDEETDPVVLAIRASNPTTPAELMRAIRNVVNLGRPREAKKYITQLMDSGPDAGTYVELQREFGSALFLKLLRDRRFAPEGPQLAAPLLAAAYAAARDPARLEALVAKLRDPSPEVRYTVVVDLRSGGSASIVALVAVLADPSRRAEHAAVRSALVQLKRASVQPLLGALESDDPWLVAQAIVVLAKLNAPQATPHLLTPYLTSEPSSTLHRAAEYGLLRLVGRPPTRNEATSFLAREVKQYINGKLAGRLDHEDMITLWGWDAEQKLPVERRYDSEAASFLLASRLANDLFVLAPDNLDYRRLYLMTLLETAKRAGGLDQALPTGDGMAHAAATALGVEANADLLKYALDANRPVAAVGAIEVLRDIGYEELLHRGDGRPAVLARGLTHPDRRVRFASMQAIMAFDPQQPFAGSSYLTEVMGYLASTIGTRRALIAHPRTDHGQTLAGMLNEVGFEADVANTGKEALQLAMRYPDYEFVLLSDALDFPDVNEFLQHLRREPRTAKLPIGVVARRDRFRRMEQLTQDDPLSETFPRPHEIGSLSLVVRRLLARAGADLVGYDERIHHASVALDHLIALAERSDKYPFYDLLRQQAAIEQAMNTPQLTDKASRVLGFLGSSSAQRKLVTLASQNARPLSERQAAASAFEVAVGRRGILLTQAEILMQYDRYNRSEILDRETQQVLGSLLDSIEKPTRSSSAEGDANTAEPE
jgi:DNA-binding response OmpR family regulator